MLVHRFFYLAVIAGPALIIWAGASYAWEQSAVSGSYASYQKRSTPMTTRAYVMILPDA
jgi:hypothetical protein